MTTDTIERSLLTGTYTIDASHSRWASSPGTRWSPRSAAPSTSSPAPSPSTPRPEPATAEVVIEAASIDTRNADRDAHLKSNDFFAMDQYPQLTFRSTRSSRGARQRVPRHRRPDHPWRDQGGLIRPRLHRRRHRPVGQHRVGFEGRTEVNRKDWGLNWNTPLDTGGVLVSEKVTLEFEISATKDA
jgi:hypothetical protein